MCIYIYIYTLLITALIVTFYIHITDQCQYVMYIYIYEGGGLQGLGL